MNFATVKQANGQNVNMPGKIVEFKGEGINQTSGKPWKKVNIIDDNNEKHQVTLRGTLPGPEMTEQRGEFAISTFQGNSPQHGAYQGFSGFWNSDAQVQPPQYSQAPQQGNQAGYQPQQQSPPPYQQQAPPPQQRPQQNNVQDDIRFAQALNRACEEYNHGKIEETGIEERTNIYYRILQTRVFPMRMGHGQEQQQPPQQQQAPPPQQPQYGSDTVLDDNIPF
jgi:hypothetical protein